MTRTRRVPYELADDSRIKYQGRVIDDFEHADNKDKYQFVNNVYARIDELNKKLEH